MARTKLIAANWKMHKSIAESVGFSRSIKASLNGSEPFDILIFPPYFSISAVASELDGTSVGVGAQNFHQEASGAYTGEVSLSMVLDVGARWVLIGHSERRHVFKESHDIIAAKMAVALGQGVKTILCVGELIEEREAGSAEAVVSEQLRTALAGVSAADMAKVVLAYEPVWAIGTGKTATPEDASEMHRHTRNWIADAYGEATAASIRIQYGGSVKPENAADLMSHEDIDGALIGGASLDPESFLAIARASS
jgi:triosephosphate isomerase